MTTFVVKFVMTFSECPLFTAHYPVFKNLPKIREFNPGLTVFAYATNSLCAQVCLLDRDHFQQNMKTIVFSRLVGK